MSCKLEIFISGGNLVGSRAACIGGYRFRCSCGLTESMPGTAEDGYLAYAKHRDGGPSHQVAVDTFGVTCCYSMFLHDGTLVKCNGLLGHIGMHTGATVDTSGQDQFCSWSAK